MTKEEALAAIKLLSALESWAFSQQSRLPDYLVEDIQRSMEVLERVVLEKNTLTGYHRTSAACTCPTTNTGTCTRRSMTSTTLTTSSPQRSGTRPWRRTAFGCCIGIQIRPSGSFAWLHQHWKPLRPNCGRKTLERDQNERVHLGFQRWLCLRAGADRAPPPPDNT